MARNAAGKYVRARAGQDAPSPAPPKSVALEDITKTVSSIKKWLKTKPSKEEAMDVFQFELDHSNRSSAVGPEGCITEYLEK